MNKKIQLSGIFSEGYGVIPKLLLKSQDISSNTKLVLAYLLSYTGAGATSFPNIDDISNDLNISKRTVLRSIKEAFTQDYLHVDKKHLGRGLGSSNLYTLLFMGDYPYLNKDASDKIAYAKNARATVSNAGVTKDKKTLMQVTPGNRNINILKETFKRNNIEFPSHLQDDNVYTKIIEFYDDREERKKKFSSKAFKLFIGKLSKFKDKDTLINAIDKAIESGWLTVYPENNRSFGSSAQPAKKYDNPDTPYFNEFERLGLPKDEKYVMLAYVLTKKIDIKDIENRKQEIIDYAEARK